jgi:hypothetical protein
LPSTSAPEIDNHRAPPAFTSPILEIDECLDQRYPPEIASTTRFPGPADGLGASVGHAVGLLK